MAAPPHLHCGFRCTGRETRRGRDGFTLWFGLIGALAGAVRAISSVVYRPPVRRPSVLGSTTGIAGRRQETEVDDEITSLFGRTPYGLRSA
jgi:hypothetical protein